MLLYYFINLESNNNIIWKLEVIVTKFLQKNQDLHYLINREEELSTVYLVRQIGQNSTQMNSLLTYF
jgi:hypothetical protein